MSALVSAQTALNELRATDAYKVLHLKAGYQTNTHIGKCESSLLDVIAQLTPTPPPGTILFDGLADAPGWQSKYTLINTTFNGGSFVDDPHGTTVQLNPAVAAVQAKQWRTDKVRLGTTDWTLLGFRFPSTWDVNRVLLWEANYPKLKYAPVALTATRDKVFVEMNTGLINWHGQTPGGNAAATLDFYKGVSDTDNVAMRITSGLLSYLLVGVHWSMGNGSVTVYQLPTGAGVWTGVWQKTVDLSGMPTQQWGYGISPPDYMTGPGFRPNGETQDGLDQHGVVKATADMVGGYDYGPPGSPAVFDMIGMVVGTTPQVVCARVGLGTAGLP